MKFENSKQSTDLSNSNNNIINQAQRDIDNSSHITNKFYFILQGQHKQEIERFYNQLNPNEEQQKELEKPYKFNLFMKATETLTLLPEDDFKEITKNLLLEDIKTILNDKTENRYTLRNSVIKTYQKLSINQLNILTGTLIKRGIKKLINMETTLNCYLKEYISPFLVEEISEFDIFQLQYTSCLTTYPGGYYHPPQFQAIYQNFLIDFLLDIPKDLISEFFQLTENEILTRKKKLSNEILNLLFKYKPNSHSYDIKIKSFLEIELLIKPLLERNQILNKDIIKEIKTILNSLYRKNTTNFEEKMNQTPEGKYLIELSKHNKPITPLGELIGMLYFEHITNIHIDSKYHSY